MCLLPVRCNFHYHQTPRTEAALLSRCTCCTSFVWFVLKEIHIHICPCLPEGFPLDRVIGPRGLLSQKARVVVTNSINHVKDYDEVILIRRGIILESGTYDSILSQPNSELCKLMYECTCDRSFSVLF
jgi:hypothetical protein